jgi:CBS domain-containing protein
MADPAPTPTGKPDRRLAGEQQTLAQPLRSLLRGAPLVCSERDTVRTAVQRMHDEQVGAIVIVDDRKRPTGVFTERDLVRTTLQQQLDAPVTDVMSRDPLALPDHTPSYEAALLMIKHGIRHVLVELDEQLV